MPDGHKLLLIKFPIVSIEDHIGKFDRLFHNLHYLLLQEKPPENIVSCEIINIKNKVNFYLTCHAKLSEPIKNLIFSLFPEVEVYELNHFLNIKSIPSHALAFSGRLSQSELYSIRTYAQTKPHDPLAAFLNILASIPPEESIFYQIVFQPIHEEMVAETSGLFYGQTKRSGEAIELPKASANMRLLYFFPKEKEQSAQQKVEEIKRTFNAFATEKNRLIFNAIGRPQEFLQDFFQRKPTNDLVLTREELASLFHIPDPQLRMAAVDWILSKRIQPPFNLPTPYNTKPEDASFFAQTNFRGSNISFGIERDDRHRHFYIIGKSGTGKSKLLEMLILNDIKFGHGVCVIDPHGDLIQEIIKFIPESRINDVVYFNVPDIQNPIPFNPFEKVSLEMKQQVAQGLIDVFKKFFGGDWSPKIEHVFRFTTLALLDYKNSTMVGMMKMLTNRRYRQLVIPEIKDSVVRHFWANEFSSWSEKFDNEAILPLVNKVGQFLSNYIIRNIVAQPNNTIHFDDILNNQKILLIELSKGRLGEENTALLGAMIITKIYQTAMERAKFAATERKDFYLYVDEFQYFATQTFENILSEARKYKLNLTLSHQYMGQVPTEIRDAVFGNVGSMLSFRIGADDAAFLAKEFHPIFDVDDFINLGVREIILKMSVEGQITPPFSAYTADMPDEPSGKSTAKTIIERCKKLYGRPVEEVNALIRELYKAEEDTNPVEEKEKKKKEEKSVEGETKGKDLSKPVV